MSKRCQVTGKKPLTGNRVSHSNIKSKHRQLPNLRKKRFWSEAQGRYITLLVSTRAMRTIDRKGIDAILTAGLVLSDAAARQSSPRS
jgi:large subunit ribosomal protein L28